MKIINKFNPIIILSVLLLIGCLPYHPSKRVAVVIFNDTSSAINYQLYLSNKWTPTATIKSNNFDYVLEYEQNANSIGVTSQLAKILILSTNCKITLKRKDINDYIKKDPEGRNTWDLHITKALLNEFKCN